MLGFYSTWPVFCCLALLLSLASTPAFKAADTSPNVHVHRIVTMDGMRGFLALAVVFHHAAIYHRYLVDGVWTDPANHFMDLLGHVGVALFFMITGFLFWSQLIRTEGRPSWITLYTGRIFRIGPLYLAAVFVLLAVVAERTGFRLHVPILTLLRQLLPWLSLGLITGRTVNGFGDPGLLLCDVAWTLQWEWWFYLSLPLLALFARRKGLHLWLVLFAITAGQACLEFYKGHRGRFILNQAMLFLMGMLVASLWQSGRVLRIRDSVSSGVLLALLAAVFQCKNPNVTLLSQVLLGLILYLVVCGSSLFGLLKTRSAIRLGDVSYGIYLLQGLVLGGVFRIRFGRVHDLASPWQHWLLTLFCAVILICVATAAHRLIERPGVLVGKKVSTALKTR